jgi:hypothetical protein
VKYYYYQFWLSTSGQSHHTTIRLYDIKPTDEDLRCDLEDWCGNHSCTGIAEHYSFGYREVNKLPKNRAICLEQYAVICKEKQKATDKWQLYVDLLGVYPFNGSNTPPP